VLLRVHQHVDDRVANRNAEGVVHVPSDACVETLHPAREAGRIVRFHDEMNVIVVGGMPWNETDPIRSE
jgi:hypothetical protein